MCLKQAFIGGFSYPSHLNEQIYGTAQAAINMKKCLIEYLGFKEENITLRLDLSPFDFIDNTTESLLNSMCSFVSKSKEGDILLIHLCGHGHINFEDNTGPLDTYFVGSDGNVITEDDFKHIFQLIPKGVSLTFIADFCFSGGMVRGLKRWFNDFTEENYTDYPSRLCYLKQRIDNVQPPSKPVIFMHSAQPFEFGICSLFQTTRGIESMSVFTYAIIKTVEEFGGNVFDDKLIESCREKCLSYGQLPGFSSTTGHSRSLFLGGNKGKGTAS